MKFKVGDRVVRTTRDTRDGIVELRIGDIGTIKQLSLPEAYMILPDHASTLIYSSERYLELISSSSESNKSKINVIESERVIMVDIDDTLIMHLKPKEALTTDLVLIPDPVEQGYVEVWKNNPMIRLVKEESARGSYLIAWSRGGFAWAISVLTALGLDDKVKQVMTKPFAYFDDSDVSNWMRDRVYIEASTKYKVKKD